MDNKPVLIRAVNCLASSMTRPLILVKRVLMAVMCALMLVLVLNVRMGSIYSRMDLPILRLILLRTLLQMWQLLSQLWSALLHLLPLWQEGLFYLFLDLQLVLLIATLASLATEQLGYVNLALLVVLHVVTSYTNTTSLVTCVKITPSWTPPQTTATVHSPTKWFLSQLKIGWLLTHTLWIGTSINWWATLLIVKISHVHRSSLFHRHLIVHCLLAIIGAWASILMPTMGTMKLDSSSRTSLILTYWVLLQVLPLFLWSMAPLLRTAIWVFLLLCTL